MNYFSSLQVISLDTRTLFTLSVTVINSRLDGMDHMPEGSETFSKIVIPSPTESETKKQVKWKDLHNTMASRDHEPPDTDPELSDTDSEPSDAYSEEMVSETNDSPAEPSKIITFTHTSTPPAENEVCISEAVSFESV